MKTLTDLLRKQKDDCEKNVTETSIKTTIPNDGNKNEKNP